MRTDLPGGSPGHQGALFLITGLSPSLSTSTVARVGLY